MPIYQTRCTKCGHAAEHILRISEELPTCSEPACEGHLEKVPSASNFSFKGGAPTPKFY